ncbi:MAG TPA: hypothetical protein VK879_12290 [Candidatus Sulfomarinibacteraceae bacterium]|nr:hypothetical protein [Candidatus Sulfomarinibacteraceae bacterium]
MPRISRISQIREQKVRDIYFFSGLCALTVLFLAVAAANLGNYWPVTADEVWIMSASYKWAEEGVFGSDLYRGYFNADRHYFMALPTQHLLLALAFRLAEPGIESARWVTLGAGVILLWTVVWLAWRWYGPAVAACTALLLLFWRSGLLGEATIPLLQVSRTARYDLTAVAFMWLSVLAATLWLRHSRRPWALAAGLFAAGALLAQFFAGAILLILGGLWAWAWRRERKPPLAGGLWLLAGLALPLLPYLLYLAAYWPDAVGQLGTQQSFRLSFGVDGLLRNVLQEGQRFRAAPQLARVAAGPWLLLLAPAPAALYLLHRLRRSPHTGDVVLALSSAASWLFLALVDSTKAPLYGIVLLPPLCLLLGLLLGAAARKVWAAPRLRSFGAFGMFLLLAPIVAEGLVFYQRERARALDAISYAQVGQTLRGEIPAGARLAGAERWWWPLRQHDYLAANSLWLRWDAAQARGGPRPTFAALAEEAGVTHILVNDNVRGDISRRHEQLQQEFWSFLQACTTVQATWQFPTYGEIALHETRAGCRLSP